MLVNNPARPLPSDPMAYAFLETEGSSSVRLLTNTYRDKAEIMPEFHRYISLLNASVKVMVDLRRLLGHPQESPVETKTSLFSLGSSKINKNNAT